MGVGLVLRDLGLRRVLERGILECGILERGILEVGLRLRWEEGCLKWEKLGLA